MSISRGNLVLAATLLSNFDPLKIFITSLIPLINLICLFLAWALFTRVRTRTRRGGYSVGSIERELSLIIATILLIIGFFFVNLVTIFGFVVLMAIGMIRSFIYLSKKILRAFASNGFAGVRDGFFSSKLSHVQIDQKKGSSGDFSLLWKLLLFLGLVNGEPARADGHDGGFFFDVALVTSLIFIFYTFFIPTMWVPTENLYVNSKVVGSHISRLQSGKFSAYVIGEDQNFLTTVATKTLAPEVYRTQDILGREVCSEYNENFFAALLSQPIITWNLSQAAYSPSCFDPSNLSVFFRH